MKKYISIIVAIISFTTGFVVTTIIDNKILDNTKNELLWYKQANTIKLQGIKYYEQYVNASESLLDKLAEDPTIHFDDVWSETPEMELMDNALNKLDSLLTSEL